MDFKKLFLRCLFSILFFLSVICAIVIIVDPYQQYRKSDIFIVNQRLEIPGIAKYHDYDMVLTGSSVAMNHYTTQVDTLFDCHSINMSVMGATSYDYVHLFPRLYQCGKLKKVIMSLDFFSYGRPPVPLELYLYDDNKWNDYSYWLSYTSLKNVVHKLTRKLKLPRDSVYRFKSPNGKEFLFKYYHLEYDSYFKTENYDLEVLKSNFDKILPALFPKNSDVEFYFYFPPYSILEYKQYQHYGYFDAVKQMKAYMCEQLLKHKNVQVFDFQNHPMVLDYDEYMDLRHYSHEYNQKIMELMRQDSCRMTLDNYQNEILKWDEMVTNFHVDDSITDKNVDKHTINK